MSPPRIRLIHETNPQKYFPAIFDLGESGAVEIAGSYRYSVFKEFLRSWLRERRPLGERMRNAAADLGFRMGLGGVKDEVVLMGFAPWDWRLLLYRGLARRNYVIYHTSWHDWGLDGTPRQPRPAALKRWLRRRWLAFVTDPRVVVVAVSAAAADGLREASGAEAMVIPHAVPEAFFEAGDARADGVRPAVKLLFVGEVSEKKGVRVLLEMMPRLAERGVTLTVVGDGPLAGDVRAAAAQSGGAVTFLGAVRDRARLAQIMGDHDVLALLSQKTPNWEELFGIVIVEALAAGMAVVASDHVGPRAILAPAAGAGLVPGGASDEAAALLARLAADPREFETLRQAQRGVAETYRIGSVAAAWRRVIAEQAP